MMADPKLEEPALELVRWTLEHRAEVRRDHQRITPKIPGIPDWCNDCEDEDWPCLSILYAAALDALDAAEKERDELSLIVSEVSPIAALDLVTSLRVENQHARDMISDLEAQVADLRAALTAAQEEIDSGELCFEFMRDERRDAFCELLPPVLARTAPKPRNPKHA